MEYKILTGENEGILEIAVQKQLDDGWVLHGYTQVRHDKWSNKDVLLQTVVKEDKEK